MIRNEGTTDRTLRILVGIALIALWPLGVVSGVFAVVLTALGAILLVTGAVGTCPLYLLFGINTCPVEGARR